MGITESQIQAQIVEYLSLRGIFCHSVPNEGAGKKQAAYHEDDHHGAAPWSGRPGGLVSLGSDRIPGGKGPVGKANRKTEEVSAAV